MERVKRFCLFYFFIRFGGVRVGGPDRKLSGG